MDVVTTSLEALIQRVTNPQNQLTDLAAIEAFCVILRSEQDGVFIATKLLATHIQSPTEWEALQSLALLDACMKRCGSSFHAEIGKFRFLNEMIKLVSPKYLGNRTPASVRQMVLKLLHSWTQEYPGEPKIKEAYEMLKKQGVLKDENLAIPNEPEDINKTPKTKHPIFEDDDRAKILRQLLQSKNPNDLQSANRLIKTMVKEDERRVEQHSRRIMELESVHNNVRLLSDMLDSHNRNQASPDDLELMKELYQACERLRPNIFILANETQDNQDLLNEILAANDELTQVFRKYISIIALGESSQTKNDTNNTSSLLDLSASLETAPSEDNSLNNKTKDSNIMPKNSQSDLEMLGDIFSSIDTGNATVPSDIPSLLPESTIMQPISIAPVISKDNSTEPNKVDSKAKALEELDTLGESLLQQSLTSFSVPRTQFNNASKSVTRVPMNSMTKPVITSTATNLPKVNSCNKDSVSVNLLQLSRLESEVAKDNSISSNSIVELLNGDDSLVDITGNEIEVERHDTVKNDNPKTSDVSLSPVYIETEIKPLTDIEVTLENIKPGTIPPLTVLEEKNGISVVLHFAKDKPRADVSVIVVTTMSKNPNPLSSYLFQAVVPKTCKCRLQPPSGTKLPGHNPFLPPSAITQIMLIANPTKDEISLKFMLSYTMEDETVTEMGEVDKLPST